jgi:hypothetical protein
MAGILLPLLMTTDVVLAHKCWSIPDFQLPNVSDRPYSLILGRFFALPSPSFTSRSDTSYGPTFLLQSIAMGLHQ